MKKYKHPIAKFHELKADRLLQDTSNVKVGQDDETPNAFSKSASISFDEDGE